MSTLNQNAKPMLENSSAYYTPNFKSYNDPYHGESK